MGMFSNHFMTSGFFFCSRICICLAAVFIAASDFFRAALQQHPDFAAAMWASEEDWLLRKMLDSFRISGALD